MGFLKDSFTIFKKNELSFIKKESEGSNIWTFYFKKPKNLHWHSGQHGLFKLNQKNLKDSTRAFTLSSSPTEDFITITTSIKESPSDFKKALFHLKPDETVTLNGPVGSFYVKEDKPLYFIAEGIGITPFYSMLKHMSNQNNDYTMKINLLYVDKYDRFPFKNHLTTLSQSLPLDIVYLTDASALSAQLKASVSEEKEVFYYLAGSKAFIYDKVNQLKQYNIPSKHIFKDSFFA
ncbi:putative oxidoreductase [Bacillus sp. TS-2]|nr:putative oxidoreductase [Bacillus sp. TS-2]